MIPYKQLSLTDVFQDCQDKFDNDKPVFLSLLEQHIESYSYQLHSAQADSNCATGCGTITPALFQFLQQMEDCFSVLQAVPWQSDFSTQPHQ